MSAQHTPGPLVRVMPAFSIGAYGHEKRDGWDVLIGDEWEDRFRLKREALAHAERIAKARGVA